MELLEGFNWLLDLSLPLASPPRDGSNDAFLSSVLCTALYSAFFIHIYSACLVLYQR